MSDIKTEVFGILETLSVSGLDLNVYQVRPEVLEEFPTLTFEVLQERPEYSTDKEIGFQDVSVQIDIYTRSSKDATIVLTELEKLMRQHDYRLTSSINIPETEQYAHKVTIFNISFTG